MATDRYGRIVGREFIGEEELSRALIAWVYPKYCTIPECDQWKELEKTARSSKIGLWSSEEAVPPWEWRKGKHQTK
jgi:micrococcal nuclease